MYKLGDKEAKSLKISSHIYVTLSLHTRYQPIWCHYLLSNLQLINFPLGCIFEFKNGLGMKKILNNRIGRERKVVWSYAVTTSTSRRFDIYIFTYFNTYFFKLQTAPSRVTYIINNLYSFRARAHQ